MITEYGLRFKKLKEEIADLQQHKDSLISDKKILKARLEEQTRKLSSASKENVNEGSVNRGEGDVLLKEKLVNAIEMSYKYKHDQMSNDIREKQAEIESLIRQNKSLKNTLEQTKIYYKREIRGLKERRRSEYDKLSSTVQELQIKLDTSQDEKDSQKLDDRYKQMYLEAQKKFLHSENVICNLENSIKVLKQANDFLNDQIKLKEKESGIKRKKLEEKIVRLEMERETDISNRLEENKKYQSLLSESKSLKSQIYDLQFALEQHRRRDLDIKGILNHKDDQASRLQMQADNEASAPVSYTHLTLPTICSV
eukprot:TRINITY_DN5630_c0_g1_i5.p1 TRINITY_DN5630_c0_g1~~TRINITY_DN5630_c0_g1_i5.p1  ORF type:complete len:311 (-),score=77.46 TRINITY_DN5630_c0_g1_i5:42-974(-)